MKTCPVCNAEIEDNARFCLYCMTSFDQKRVIKLENKKKISFSKYVPLILILTVLIAAVFLLFKNRIANEIPATAANTESAVSDDSDNPTDTADKTEISPGSTDAFTKKDGGDPTKQDQSESTQNADAVTANSGNAKSEEFTDSPGEETQDKPALTPVSSVEYLWRNAKSGDDYSTSANIENCVVITGIKTPEANGEYTIPDTIDGKRVIAVIGGAFSGDNVKQTVKKVTVSSNVKTIWNYAFGGCNNLTDIYFKGNAIYTEALAFKTDGARNGSFTIHCSADCNDRNFRYYKNTAPNYGAVWEEWNG